MMRSRATYCLVSLLLGSAVLAQATPITNSFGLSSPSTTITFDEFVFPIGTVLTTEYSGLGVTFSPGLSYDSQGPAAFPGITGHYVGNNNPCCFNPFSLFFAAPITEAAFGFATNPATTTLTARLAGSPVESFSVPTNFFTPGTAFLGFTGIVFDEIEVLVGGDTRALVDNIQMGATVPEPGSLLLLGLGLSGMGWLRRRRTSP